MTKTLKLRDVDGKSLKEKNSFAGSVDEEGLENEDDSESEENDEEEDSASESVRTSENDYDTDQE